MILFLWFCHVSKCTLHLCCSAFFKMPSNIESIATNKITLVEYLPWTIYLGCSVIFDILVLALSLSPQLESGFQWKKQSTYTYITRRFYFDALFYFTMSLLVSTFNLVWIVLHRHNGLLWAIAGPM